MSTLQDRIALFNSDYEDLTGEQVSNFLCPIRRTDEPGELIKGHVISQTLENCSRVWVPQRGDVDGVFGSVEAEFHKHFAARIEDPIDLLTDKKAYKQVNPKIELKGVELRSYYDASQRVAGSNIEVPFIVEVPLKHVEDKNHVDVEIVIDRDDRAVAFLSALHSAHLTMFHLNGYTYALGPAGLFIADILNDYCTKAMSLSRTKRIELAKEYHASHEGMHVSLGNAGGLKGTVDDKHFLSVWTENGICYAWGIIVRFNSDLIVVFMPIAPDTQVFYFDQLDGKFSQLNVKITRMIGSKLRINQIEVLQGPPATLLMNPETN